MLITREAFMKRYNISEELFQSAGMSWEELCSIYEDFETKKSDKYEKIRENFYNSYLKNIDRGKEDVKVHSICSRVKDSEHLIAKIVRKKQENQRKYGKLDKNNYEKFITDLIGIRCLVLFKSDWQSFHQYIVSKFEDNAKYYIKDSIQDFDDNENHFYIAEKPKVHIRNGDPRDIYDEMLSPDSIIDGKGKQRPCLDIRWMNSWKPPGGQRWATCTRLICRAHWLTVRRPLKTAALPILPVTGCAAGTVALSGLLTAARRPRMRTADGW